jgi:hypothetical protein
MVALMTMLEGKDEEPDAVRMSTLHASSARTTVFGMLALKPSSSRTREPY